MPRDHFKQTMMNPRFHTEAYKESKEAKSEAAVEAFIAKLAHKLNLLRFLKK
jgi:hypothetical protein